MSSRLHNRGDAFWSPFTANRRFKAAPRLFTAAKGMYYTTLEGRQVLDGIAGLWCVNAGHAPRRIVEAIQRQAAALDFVSSFNMGHPLAFETAERLVALAPEGLDHAFFSNSGSEAMDTALKIVRAYHRLRGEGGRTRFIGREKAYHGVGFGGLSVGGIGRHRRDFGPLLSETSHLPLPYDPARDAFTRGQPEDGRAYADALLTLFNVYDPSTIAAVVVEPATGSGGVYAPPKDYLQRLRDLCNAHGVLLIFDEVITGFGRFGGGSAFAAEATGVTPDVLTCAKGLTNGAVPMAATLVSPAIYDAFMTGPETQVELWHGYTYSAHPLACAAALAAMDVYEEQGLFGRAAALSGPWEAALHSLKGEPHIIDIRNIGLMGAVELAPGDAAGARGSALYEACFANDVLVRLSGDSILLSPPLIIDEEEIGRIVETMRQGLRSLR